MLRLLTRYALFELLKVFFIALTGLTLLIILVGVVQEAAKQGLGLVPILQVIPYLLPEALRFALPGTILLAVSNVYGRMSAMNEIVALKSLGISPLTVVWPAIAVGLALSFVGVVCNEMAVTWGRMGVQRVVVASAEQIILGMLRTQRSYSAGEISMNVKAVEQKWLLQPTLTMQASGDKPSVTITAEKAEIDADPDAGTLTIRFHDAVIDVGNRGGVIWPGVYEHVVLLSEFSRKGDRSDSPSSCPMSEIPQEVRAQERYIARFKQESAAQAAFQLITGELEPLATEAWLDRRNHLQSSYSRLYRLQAEPHRRWANGFACFSFVVIGSAMAIRRAKGEFLTSFFLCFLPILLAYYPMLIYSVGRVKNGAMPPETVWLGNFVLLVWGIWLLRRVLRF